MNRFWFVPGESTFVEDEDAVWLSKLKVALLTEEEFLSKTGEVIHSGRPDSFAQRFAQAFSDKSADIAESKARTLSLGRSNCESPATCPHNAATACDDIQGFPGDFSTEKSPRNYHSYLNESASVSMMRFKGVGGRRDLLCHQKSTQ